MIYPFEERSALKRVVIEVVFSGGWENGTILGRFSAEAGSMEGFELPVWECLSEGGDCKSVISGGGLGELDSGTRRIEYHAVNGGITSPTSMKVFTHQRVTGMIREKTGRADVQKSDRNDRLIKNALF